MIAIYTLMVLPIVIWIMRDQFALVPVELEEAALVDGLSIWGAFLKIVLPLVLRGILLESHIIKGMTAGAVK